MSRTALIVSCALHGSVLALVGWSSWSIVTRPEREHAALSISLTRGDDALVSGDPEAPPQAPASKAAFIPPPAEIDPPPYPLTSPANTPPPLVSVSNTMPTVPSMSSVPPAKVSRGKRSAVASTHGRGSAESGIAEGRGGGGAAGGNDYTPPQFLLRYKPPYPEQARAQRLEGVVLLLVSVDAAGRVTGAAIRQSCGHLVLDRAALDAVRSWRFNPAHLAGRAIPASVELPIRFNFSA